MRKFTFFLFVLFFSQESIAQNISGIVNSYAVVDSITNSICQSTVHVNDTAGFGFNDKVLIIQMEGGEIDTTNTATFGTVTNYFSVGNYEFARIDTIINNQIHLDFGLQRVYNTNQAVQLVKVPEYVNATVTGTLTALPWNDSTGGVLAIEVAQDLILQTNIDVSAQGFIAGQSPHWGGVSCGELGYFYPSTSNGGVDKGEGIYEYALNKSRGRGAAANAGGGGNNHNAGGGGGSNGGVGGQGGDEWSGCSGSAANGGIGGWAMLYSNTANKIFMGGGGGAGHNNQSSVNSPGGNGAGIILINANNIVGNGNSILANGEDGLSFSNTFDEGRGGGGAAGVIILDVANYTGNLTLEAIGGEGGSLVTNNGAGPGGGGGGGVVWLSLNSLPSNVTANLLGGDAGEINGGGNYGATDGQLGTILYNHSLSFTISNNFLGQDTTLCSGDTLLLDVTTNNASYLWQDNSTDSTFLVMQQGTYWVEVTVDSCVRTDTIVVNYDTIPTISLGNDTALCQGDSMILDATTSGATYLWQDNSTDSTFTVNQQGTYWVEITFSGGCSKVDSITINYNSLPIITVFSDTSICMGDSVNLSASGGIGYAWNTGDTTSTINVSPTNFTSYYVTATDGKCENTDSVTVGVDTIPIPVITGIDSICQGDTTTLVVAGALSYVWNTGNTTSAIMVFPSTTTTYYVTATDSACSGIDSVTVVVTPFPTITLSNDTTICAPANISLSANSSSSVSWSTGSNSNTISVSPTTNTTYYVTATENNCSVIDSVVVQVEFTPSVNIQGNPNVCEGQSVFLEAQGIGNFTWSTGSNDTSIIVNPNGTTTYYVTSTNTCGLDVDSITVTVHPAASAGAETDTTIFAGESVQLSGTGGPSWSWSPPEWLSCTTCANPIATPLQTTTYYLTVVDENGCAATDSVIIIISDRELAACEDAVFVPNIFSPNGDSQNDVLYARGIDYDLEVFRVFDRWGNKVFETTDPTNGWDGKHNGTLANSGVFAFYVEAICHLTGETVYFQGNVTLIR